MAVSDNTRGALLMVAGMAAFTVNDAFMKGLSGTMPLMQAVFLRGIGTSIFLLLLARALGGLRLTMPRRDLGMVGLRILGEVSSAWLFLTALFHMPLANVSAILQALPLTITLAGAVFLGEPVGWRRMTAILVGFLGVMLIVRPGMEGFTIYSLYALAAVAAVTLRDLATRRVSREVPSLTVAFLSSVAVTLFGAVGSAAGTWAPVGGGAALGLAGATLFLFLGYLCSVMVMRTGDIGFIAPFRYTALIWALALGYLMFGDWPDAPTLAGAALVAATGVFTLWRERAAARGRRQPLRYR